jgi:hypothetical protein
VTLLSSVPGRIRRFGLDRRPITGSGTVPAAPPGDTAGRRPAGRPRDDGGTSGHKVRAAAGNGRERQGTALTLARTLPSISKVDRLGGMSAQVASPGQLRANTLEVAATAGVGTSPLQSATAISGLVGQADDVVTCRARSRRLLADQVGSAERPPCRRGQRRRPGVRAKSCPCCGPRRWGQPVKLGLRKPASAPISSPRSARGRPEPGWEARGPARRRVTGDRRVWTTASAGRRGRCPGTCRWPAAGAPE